MRGLLVYWIVALALSFPALGGGPAALVITDVNVLPMDVREVTPGQTVIIRDGIILEIGDALSVSVPAGAETVDGHGKYLMPGLADMHVHLPKQRRNGFGVEEFLLLNMAAGVTSVRSMRGAEDHLALRTRIESGDLLGPRLYLSAPPIFGQRTFDGASVEEFIAKSKREGFDLIKILSTRDAYQYDQIMAAAAKIGIPVAGHVPASVGIERAVRSGQASIEHLQGYFEIYEQTPDEAIRWIKESAKHKIYNCPTVDWYIVGSLMIPLEELRRRPGLQYIAPAQREQWEQLIRDHLTKEAARPPDRVEKERIDEKRGIANRLAIVKAMDRLGVPLLLSPDANSVFGVPGFGMYAEMQHYADAGLSPYSILKAATANAGACLGADWGVVGEGKRADLILLSANPLEDVSNVSGIEGVVLDGQWFSRRMIDEKLESLKSKLR